MHGRQCPPDKPKFEQPESGFQSRVDASSSIIGPWHNETISLISFFDMRHYQEQGIRVLCPTQWGGFASFIWDRELTPTVCHNSIIGDIAVQPIVLMSLLKDGCVAIVQGKENAPQTGQGRILLRITSMWSLCSF